MRRSRLFHWIRGTVLAAPMLTGGGCSDQTYRTTVPLSTAELRAYADARWILSQEDCAFLCATDPLDPKDETVRACTRVDADHVECTYGEWVPSGCSVPVAGRRTEGLADPRPVARNIVGAALARAAWFEAGSVPAFERLHEELAALGAPDELLVRTLAARDDERRHAHAVSTLARAHGGVAATPALTPSVGRAIVDLAIENVVEGCVGESWAALVAGWQSEHAAHADLRAVYARIAEDEAGHADLSFSVAAFLHGHLDAAACDRVEAARRAALDALLEGASLPVDAVLVQSLGLPDAAAAAQLASALAAHLSQDVPVRT